MTSRCMRLTYLPSRCHFPRTCLDQEEMTSTIAAVWFVQTQHDHESYLLEVGRTLVTYSYNMLFLQILPAALQGLNDSSIVVVEADCNSPKGGACFASSL